MIQLHFLFNLFQAKFIHAKPCQVDLHRINLAALDHALIELLLPTIIFAPFESSYQLELALTLLFLFFLTLFYLALFSIYLSYLDPIYLALT